MPSKDIELLKRVDSERDEGQSFPIEWLEEANVAVALSNRFFTLYVLNNHTLDIRNGWEASQRMHSKKGTRIVGWHFSNSFVDGETGEDETISYTHFMEPPDKGKNVIYFLKVKFGKEKMYMVTIAKRVRDYLEIYGD